MDKNKNFFENQKDSIDNCKKEKENNESKKNEEIENKINAMLDKVMEDQDNLENNNKYEKSLEFNDDEENEENNKNTKINQSFFPSNFERGNKRIKTFDNYSVNFPNFPFIDMNKFNINNNFASMRTPSLGFENYNNPYNIDNNQNLNDINNLNNISINNNIDNSNSHYIRNSMPYSKTTIYRYPINMFNINLDNSNYNINNFQNFNNNSINNQNSNNSLQQKPYKRNESRRRTCPSFNYNINEKVQKDFQNFNKKYNNRTDLEQKNNSENLLFQLKYNLERIGKIDNFIYNLVKGKFLSIIKNHKGSKIFQKYLRPTHCDILHQIFIELSSNLEELITDNYANYFCKRFFPYLNQKDRICFLNKIEKSLVKLSSHSIGTYPIQTMIEYVGSKNEKVIIISTIKNSIKELSIDPFGSHVIEKLLTCFEEEYISFIYDYVCDNFLSLAYNNYGICIVKKILSFTHKKNLHEKLKKLVKENAMHFVNHPYANFVIQVIIECWSDYKEILDIFYKKYFYLSLEKYGSNVVERCLEKDEILLNNYIDEIINSNHIYEVMKSNYGNYVIQKAIKLSKGESKNRLVFNAAKNVNKLNDCKLITKWKSILSTHISELSEEQIQYLKEQQFF